MTVIFPTSFSWKNASISSASGKLVAYYFGKRITFVDSGLSSVESSEFCQGENIFPLSISMTLQSENHLTFDKGHLVLGCQDGTLCIIIFTKFHFRRKILTTSHTVRPTYRKEECNHISCVRMLKESNKNDVTVLYGTTEGTLYLISLQKLINDQMDIIAHHRFDGKFNSAITRIYPINKEYFLVACKDGHVLLVRKYEDTLCGQSWLEQPSDSSSHVVSISHYFIKTELYVVILFGSGNLKHYEIIIDPKEECIFDTEESSFCPFSVPRKSVFIGDSDIRQNTKNATIGDFYVLSDTQFISIAKNVIPSSIGVVWDHDKNLVVLSLFECDNMEIIYRESTNNICPFHKIN
eukprot:GHVP01002994.1.p1 GENE.GHVP01002994.1~~GHVP01002994.1.p1  ORF type:complete len:360 (-),score=46.86 GHVP01002994.1:121-1173(-)